MANKIVAKITINIEIVEIVYVKGNDVASVFISKLIVTELVIVKVVL